MPFILILSFLCLGVLAAPAKIGWLAVYLGINLGAAVCFLSFGKEHVQKMAWISKRDLVHVLMIVFVLGRELYLRWLPSSKIAALSAELHLEPGRFLPAAGAVLGIGSVFAVELVIDAGVSFFHSLCGKAKRAGFLSKAMPVLAVCFLEFLCIEYSAVSSLDDIFSKGVFTLLVNVSIVLLVNLLFSLFLPGWRPVLTVTSVLFFLWGLADYFTIKYHGSPLFISEFANAGTAAAVVRSYSFWPTPTVVCIALFFASAAAVIHRNQTVLAGNGYSRNALAARAAAFMLTAVFSIVGFKQVNSRIEPWMPWNLSVPQSGFLVRAVRDADYRRASVTEPEGYDPAAIRQAARGAGQENGSYPDLILILNETFFDLTAYADIPTDMDHMEAFYGIKGAFYGYAATASVAGGTNNSEFELLSSRSMFLLNHSAPFTYLSPEQLERGTVDYLNKLGYETTGMHCESRKNYSRDTAYPALGFDHIIFDGFTFHKNGNRSWLDSDNYLDMIALYENADDSPQFMYILTFQNHGGYEQNDASLDTVHALGDYGALTDDIDELLSSVRLSAEAFHELTEYYRNIDRQVVICMVGDHAPPFATELPGKTNGLFSEKNISLRLVPYVMWSNYGADFSACREYVSMVDLVPLMLKAAGLPLSAFYEYILELGEALPIRTSDGIIVDNGLAVSWYGSDNEYFCMLNQYYYMEYNSLLSENEYLEELFLPPIRDG